MSHAPFHGIEDVYATPAPGDHARLREIFDLMAELEITSPTCLALGLKASYGWELPDALPDKYPVTLHYPAPEGVRFSSLMSGTAPAHPGGKREHRHLFEIFLVIRPREGARLEQLMNLSVDWLYVYDALYSRNPRLGGRLLVGGLVSAVPGILPYAGTDYFGWKMRGDLCAQYFL